MNKFSAIHQYVHIIMIGANVNHHFKCARSLFFFFLSKYPTLLTTEALFSHFFPLLQLLSLHFSSHCSTFLHFEQWCWSLSPQLQPVETRPVHTTVSSSWWNCADCLPCWWAVGGDTSIPREPSR